MKLSRKPQDMVWHSSTLQARIWGIYESFKLVWSQGFERIAETDNGDTLNLFSLPFVAAPFALVRAIANLCVKSRYLGFHKIRQEANEAADYMAKASPT
ncbi:hypothetical protein V6N11_034851 [Hibiscus sabdariffa]|uniref:RNase H type-1 domain-containing protein n=1 Tax=Hibiscus sabdariffa TaxID=183260 RepID=A0ABR1ZLY2_9ROSI